MPPREHEAAERPPLLEAAREGQSKNIEQMLEEGVDVNQGDKYNYTALILAAENGHDRCVEALIKAGADVNTAASGGYNALICAAADGHDKCVELLIQAGADVNGAIKIVSSRFKGEDGVTALMKAARNGHVQCVELLLKAGAEVNRVDREGSTALVHAVWDSRLECIKKLLEAGAHEAYGPSPLHIAVQNDHLECVKALIVHYSVNAPPDKGRRPLMAAAKNGNCEILDLLLESGAQVHCVDAHGNSALSFAAQFDHVECIERLLRAAADPSDAIIQAAKSGHVKSLTTLLVTGANVNKQDSNGCTPLLHAVEKGHNECVNVLIKAGAGVNNRNGCGETALMKAAAKGYVKCIEMLLQAGAVSSAKEKGDVVEYLQFMSLEDQARVDVNACSYFHRTALMYAAESGHDKCVDVLIKAEADVNFRTDLGTPLIYAMKGGCNECVNLLIKAGAEVTVEDFQENRSMRANRQCVEQLLEKGVDVNSLKVGSITALIEAAISGHDDCVEVLLKAGANVNAQTKKGNTALICAAIKGHHKCVKLLIDAGADLDIANREGFTALMKAVQNAEAPCARSLIEAGADVNISYASGHTALLCAAKSGKEVFEALFKAGANINVPDKQGYTPLMEAVICDHRNVDLLIQAGANVNAVDRNGTTALMRTFEEKPARRAHGYSMYKCMKSLITAGADVNHTDRIGNTALTIAARNAANNIQCIKLLLQSEADVNITQTRFLGTSPMMETALSDYYGLARFRVKKGLKPDPKKSAAHCIRLMLKAGAHANVKTKGYANVLQGYIALREPADEEVASLLRAAGDTIDGSSIRVKDIPQRRYVDVPAYLLPTDDSLKHPCREAIRKHLLQLSPVNLFLRVPKLPDLPSVLHAYLLYGMSLEA